MAETCGPSISIPILSVHKWAAGVRPLFHTLAPLRRDLFVPQLCPCLQALAVRGGQGLHIAAEQQQDACAMLPMK